MVHGPREHDGHLLRRFHLAAGGEPRARAPDLDHPDVLHGRPLHRRLPLPRRAHAQVLRRQHVRQHDVLLERPAGLPRVVGGLGGGVGGAPRRQRAVPARVVPPPDRFRLLAQRLGGPRRRSHQMPRLSDRRLARRLSEPAAAPVPEPAGAEEGADRPVGSPSAGRGGAGPAHRPPPRGRALARPLVRRQAERRHDGAARGGLHAGGRAPRGRPARLGGRLAGGDGVAGSRRERARPAPARRRPARR